jgi:hypothetical protein
MFCTPSPSALERDSTSLVADQFAVGVPLVTRTYLQSTRPCGGWCVCGSHTFGMMTGLFSLYEFASTFALSTKKIAVPVN